MRYVIKRNGNGAYVAPSGSKHSYVKNIVEADVFASRLAARSECCGNETAVDVEDELRPLRYRLPRHLVNYAAADAKMTLLLLHMFPLDPKPCRFNGGMPTPGREHE